VKKILFINTETSPYVAESTLAMMGKNVPELAQSNGCEIRTFMPKWGNINERRGQLHEMQRLSGMNIIINGTDHPLIIKVASIPVSRVQVYFIDNEDYFTRKGIEYDENGTLYPDNGERAIFFARGVLEITKKLKWTPDIIHCQGWMTALVPLYLKKAYNDEPCFRNVKIISSVCNIQESGSVGENFKNSIAYKDITAEELAAYNDNISMSDLNKIAIEYSDGIIEMTEDVAPEIIEQAQSLGKKILKYPGENFIEQYKEFYEEI